MSWQVLNVRSIDMSNLLLAPPVAFLIYVGLVGILALVGRWLVGSVKESPTERAAYASGEAPPRYAAVPGYRQFFIIALFFAILHLGVLVLGSEGRSLTAIVYLAGLFLALVALILG
jgi:NADH:ubiquinone oxidoreductase subunit 3 (subunit A)